MKIIELDNNKYTIKQSLEDHKGYIVQAIEFNKNELISISNDKEIKFWNLINEKFKNIKSVTFQNNQNYAIGILKISNSEFVTVDNGDGKLKFWNYQNYTMIKEYKESISSNWNNSQLCLVNEKYFIFCNNNLYLFDIDSKELIKKYDIKNTYSVICCFDGTILCGEDKKLTKYKLNNKVLEKIDEAIIANNQNIYALVETLNGTIIFNDNNLIKIWN